MKNPLPIIILVSLLGMVPGARGASLTFVDQQDEMAAVQPPKVVREAAEALRTACAAWLHAPGSAFKPLPSLPGVVTCKSVEYPEDGQQPDFATGLFYGAVLMVVMLYAVGGAAAFLRQLWAWRPRKS